MSMKRLKQSVAGLFLFLLVISMSSSAFGQDGNGLSPEIQNDIENVENVVVELRELDPATDIDRELVLEDELRTLVEEDFIETYTSDALRRDRLFYATLGFIPLETDLFTLLQNVQEEQVAGFYDTDINTMYVLSAEGGLDAFASVIYAHEYQHAVQDANFDLDHLIDEDRLQQEPDYGLAQLALVEGDAQLMTLLYTQWLAENRPLAAMAIITQIGDIDTTQLDNAPEIIQRELAFPYEQGLSFVQTIYDESGWRLVNGIYERPPLSTEQILHPNLYLTYEEPQIVENRSMNAFWEKAGLQGWEEIRSHALGEFYIREHLRLAVDGRTAFTAAAGWGGDLFTLYANEDDETIAVWRSEWDTPKDRDEFNNTYRVFASNWTGTSAAVDNSSGTQNVDSLECWEGLDFGICKTLEDNEILIGIAPDLGTAQEVIDFQLTPDDGAS